MILKRRDELDDDAEGIITNDRYVYIAELIKGAVIKRRVLVAFHHPIRLTELLQTDGWDFRYSQLCVPCILHSNGNSKVQVPQTGQTTTGCSVTAGIYSVSVHLLTQRLLTNSQVRQI